MKSEITGNYHLQKSETQKKWIELSCTVPAEAADVVSDYLVQRSSNGVSIDNQTVDTFSTDTIEEPSAVTIKGYFAADIEVAPLLEGFRQHLLLLTRDFPSEEWGTPQISEIREEAWATSWKDNFKPIRTGRHLVVKPTWETFAAAAGDTIIEIDPGMAFGTGSHATTKLCLEAIEEILMEKAHFGERSLLDVGTGSGVLAIAAAKLGAAPVEGIDIDPEAVNVAITNAAVNNVTTIKLSITPLEKVAGTFTVIVANILAEELVRMAPKLVERLKPEAWLVLSGILIEKEQLVLDGFSSLPLDLEQTTREGEWSCIIYRRRQ